MDVPAIAALASDMSQANTANAVQLAVLKLAINTQAQTAEQLLQAAQSGGGGNNPPNLGNRVDTFA